MKQAFELLAPGGDIKSIKAAISAGADAVYCGLNKFNARDRATNLSFDSLVGIVDLAHAQDCKVFITINIMILESEIPELMRFLNRLVNTQVDGLIVQDIGLFYLAKTYFPQLDVHASTQTNTHNTGQIQFLKSFNASRFNLSRELNINEIKQLTEYGREQEMLCEVFVHGSYCISFSGLCYMSSVRNGTSGNRGRCAQPCRDGYQKTKIGRLFPLNMKDNSAFADLPALADAGVYSLKIEGRIKKSHYVYTVVDQWRQQIDAYNTAQPLLTDNTALYTVYNRDFSNGYLQGTIGKEMYIDNPRDNAAQHFIKQQGATSEQAITAIKQGLYDSKTQIIKNVQDKIASMDDSSANLHITASGQIGEPLTMRVQSSRFDFTLHSQQKLSYSETDTLGSDEIQAKFKSLNKQGYQLKKIDVTDLAAQSFIDANELQRLKEQIAKQLNNNQILTPEVNLPKRQRPEDYSTAPRLVVLFDNIEEAQSCAYLNVDRFYQLPEAIAPKLDSLVSIFTEDPTLLPCFPAILIGEHFDAAITLLKQISKRPLITHNSGIAFHAAQLGLPWIAGSQLNLSNGYSLQALQSNFACAGAFISNEINHKQVKHIIRPEGFDCYYSILHPIMLMVSRQCFFLNSEGCKKQAVGKGCLSKCKKNSHLISLRNESYVIDKQAGEYNRLYAQQHYLNTEIVSELAGRFSHFMIDLRDIQTDTRYSLNKVELITQFQSLLNGEVEAADRLHEMVQPTTREQAKKGL